jgi:hypothetical protein
LKVFTFKDTKSKAVAVKSKLERQCKSNLELELPKNFGMYRQNLFRLTSQKEQVHCII